MNLKKGFSYFEKSKILFYAFFLWFLFSFLHSFVPLDFLYVHIKYDKEQKKNNKQYDTFLLLLLLLVVLPFLLVLLFVMPFCCYYFPCCIRFEPRFKHNKYSCIYRKECEYIQQEKKFWQIKECRTKSTFFSIMDFFFIYLFSDSFFFIMEICP